MAVSGCKPMAVLRSHLSFSSQNKCVFQLHIDKQRQGLPLHEFVIVSFCYSRRPFSPALLTDLGTAIAYGAC